MVAVGNHPRIRLLTFAEIEEVQGYIGNFKIKVRKKARYVDTELCNSCGMCYEACPSRPYPVNRKLVLGEKVIKTGRLLETHLPRPEELKAEAAASQEAETMLEPVGNPGKEALS